MSSKAPGKDKGGLQEKLKSFFGVISGKDRSSPVTAVGPPRPKVDFTLTLNIIKDLSQESPLNCRLKTIKELSDVVLNKHLEDLALETLCNNTLDLANPQKYPIDARHTVLKFYCCLIQGQYEKLTLMRSFFFRFIKEYTVADDLTLRFEMLKALTDNGKIIVYFEEEAGPFLLEWMPEVINAGKAAEFLSLLVNIIKFNASYLDQDIISGFVQHTCKLIARTTIEDDIYCSFEVLDAVVCYSHLPSEALTHFITALCNTVSTERYCNTSWKLMRNLLGTHLGHSSICTMCRLIRDSSNRMDFSLLRGAVFFVSMALWGSKRIPSLKHKPDAVLPSFRQALECNNPMVAYEVVLSIQRLLNIMNKDLHLITWDVILDIIERLILFPEVNSDPSVSQVASGVHNLVTTIEQLHEKSLYNGDTDKLYDIVEKLSAHRPDSSVLKLIHYRAEFLDSTKENWIPGLKMFMEKYFKQESRSTVKIHALDVFKKVMDSNRHFFEDELIDHVAIPFINVESDQDSRVKTKVVKVLIDLSNHCNSKRCFEILDIIEKIIIKCREAALLYCKLDATDSGLAAEEVGVLQTAIRGVIEVFKKKLYISPSCYAIRCYKILKTHLLAHYSSNSEFLNYTSCIREDIFYLLLQLRANAIGQLGLADQNDKAEFSPYIHVAYTKGSSMQSCSETTSPPILSPAAGHHQLFTPSYLCLKEVCQCIVLCLQHENDWPVLKVVLTELLKFLLHKTIILCCLNGINDLCAKICLLVTDRNSGNPETLRHAPTTFSRSEFQLYVFPVISGLTAYHRELEPGMQYTLISSLEFGLVSKCAPLCISFLTLCTLEMQDAMYKRLPHILLSLSKISATVTVALPSLEFLSTLIRLSNLYVSFVEDQYMSIFAIALPYTNPSKFNQYIVALAHHVIAMWFLKCKLSFRKDFVRFIAKGLRTNASIPREETSNLLQSQNLSADSHEQRRRSSSLNEQSGRGDNRSSTDSSMMSLHLELMETSMDLMARYTFGMCSSLPKRTSLMEFLLEKGQSMSWLLGNKVITITTSGCGSATYKGGLCDKCYYLCAKDSLHDDEPPASQPSTAPVTFERQSQRRRHWSAVQSSSVAEARIPSPRTLDDTNLPQRFGARTSPKPLGGSGQEGKGFSLSSGDNLQQDSPGDSQKSKSKLCSCWCQGWAEIHIRRPTGNTSWMMRIQNAIFPVSELNDFPLPDLANLFKHLKLLHLLEDKSSPGDVSLNPAPESVESGDLDVKSKESKVQQPGPEDNKQESENKSSSVSQNRSGSPFRRTNSSPEMKPEGLANLESANAASVSDTADNQSDSVKISDSSGPSTQAPPSDEVKPSKKDSYRARLHLDLSSLGTDKKAGTEPVSPVTADFERKAKSPPRSPPTKKTRMTHRDRGYTISVMSPVRYHPGGFNLPSGRQQVSTHRDSYKHGLSPRFVFLQLYHSSHFGHGCERPLLLPRSEVVMRALNVLDLIPPYETHKIGVVYVGPGQANNETAILSNSFGSVRYTEFLQGLGTLISLKDVNQQKTYIAGLDQNGSDGKFAYSWQDDIMQVIFHVATLMPNKESDRYCHSKKLHIGNDFVTIVYNDSGEDYDISTIKGQFTYACIIIHPGEYNSNIVLVKGKPDLIDQIGHNKPQIISDDSLSVFVRQLALHADLASVIWTTQHSSSKDPYVSNWLERLRNIKRLRSKVSQENPESEEEMMANEARASSGESHPSVPEDFTCYT